MSGSRISGFYRQTLEGRVRILVERGFLGEAAADQLIAGEALLPPGKAVGMIENVVGVFGLPFGVAPNFLINDREHVVPMVVEEPSIVAAVSAAANLVRAGGGFSVTADRPLLIGQIQLSQVDDAPEFIAKIEAEKPQLIAYANSLQPNLLTRGGGVQDIDVFERVLPQGDSLIVLHLLVDTCDAMGANLVNTLCEALGAQVERLAGGTVGLQILSNLADKALVTARATVPLEVLGDDTPTAEKTRDNIVLANDFALVDPHRAATHNKGIMNGIDAVALATGNDWRAIEAGAHAFAARKGSYQALTAWSVAAGGQLAGTLTLPLKPGIVGGSLQSNPGAAIGLALSGANSATELAQLMCATGLAQNLAALKALVSSGIQAGHMALHARSVATSADVPEAIFDAVVSALIASGEIKIWKARELCTALSGVGRKRVQKKVSDAAVGRAAGKVILLGEHAVVYGRHALALPIPDAVTVAVRPAVSGIRIHAADWHYAWDSARDDRQRPAGIAASVDLIVNELDLAGDGFEIEIHSRIPIGKGLGSSAAVAVAVIRAFDELGDTQMTAPEIDRIALKCEQITHGTPSGIDNHLATYALPTLFRMKHNPVSIETTEPMPLVIAACSQSGNTSSMVAAVRQRYASEQAVCESILDSIDVLARMGAEAMRNADYDRLGVHMNLCQGLLNALGVSTPELEKMIALARSAGAIGAKLTGSGGGGSIVALCPGSVSKVSQRLSAAGYQIVSIVE